MCIVVMAVTESGQGHRGISAFIIERGTPGFRAGKKEDKLGMRASETSEVDLRELPDSGVAAAGQEGQGFVNALQVLDAGRIGIAALAVGLAQGAYDAARELRVRSQAVRSADRHVPERRAKLVDAATRIQAARLLTYRAASMKDAGARSTLEVGDGQAVLERDRGAGVGRRRPDPRRLRFVKDYPAEKYFRDVKLTTIGEGTSEIQRLVIARQLLALDKMADGPRD